jgi:hypothetical protein
MTRTDSGGHYDVVWPRGERKMEPQPLAPRLDSLEGKTIAELWDFRFRGDEVADIVQENFKARFPGVRFISWKEFGSTHGQDERAVLASLQDKFKEMGVDAAISSMGC